MMKSLIRSIFCCVTLIFFSSCAKDIVDLTGEIRGIVKDDSTGQLLQNCKVSLSPGGESVSTDANGIFSFKSLDPGSYSLLITKSGYVDETQDVTIVAGQTTQVNVFLKLPPVTTGSVTGTVKDSDNGQLLSNCNITITPGGLSKITSSQGFYEFSELDPGKYLISFTKSGYESSSTYVTVSPGKESSLDVLLKAKSSFSLSQLFVNFFRP